MAVKNRTQERQKLTPNLYINRNTATNNFLFTMLATFGGVMIGVLAALSIVKADIHAQVASETAKLNNQIVRFANADLTTNDSANPCTGTASPQGGIGGGNSVMTAAAVTNSSQPAGGQGGGTPSGNGGDTFVHKLVSGVWATVSGTNSDTGPYSNNEVKSTITNTTTVKNDTDVNIQNTTNQNADSGNANVSGNTNGGTATTGNAANSNETNLSVSTTN